MEILLENNKIDTETLPYRQGVIGIVIDSENNFLIVQMNSYLENEWRFPGGGLEEGEDPQTALLREFEEELGSQSFTVLAKSSYINQYDWNEAVILESLAKRGKAFRGQQQSQFLVRFTGNHEELQLDHSELRQAKWIPYSQLEQYLVFPYQWTLAQQVLNELLGQQ